MRLKAVNCPWWAYRNRNDLRLSRHQAQKTGKSVPGGYVFGRTRYENTAKVRLVGTFEPRQTRSAAQEKFHKWALRGKPGLPGFQGAG